jgi:pimeloyl-ACP methyl ester carboxylesterase
MTTLSLAGQVPELPDCFTPSYRAGRGTPLVLLHGATMSWRAWRPVLPFLVGRHDVFAPTLTGHRGGPGLRPGATPGMAAIVDQLCDQFDEAGIETAHLVGNSLGGWVALELARRGRARSVVAFSPAGAWRSRRDFERLVALFGTAHAVLGNPMLGPLVRNRVLQHVGLTRVAAHPGRIPAEDVREMIADMVGCEMFGAMFRSGLEVSGLAPFDVAHCPVRIAWASRDRVISYRRFGRPMRELVPGAEFSLLPGIGHLPMYDDPRLVARTVLELTSVVDAANQVEPPLRSTRRPRRRTA